MTVRVRLGHGVARLGPAPILSLELAPGATVGDACARLSADHPALAPALPYALTIVGGSQVAASHRLAPGDELALVMPLSGG
jgi:molybdopterin converting factor small subunit